MDDLVRVADEDCDKRQNIPGKEQISYDPGVIECVLHK